MNRARILRPTRRLHRSHNDVFVEHDGLLASTDKVYRESDAMNSIHPTMSPPGSHEIGHGLQRDHLFCIQE